MAQRGTAMDEFEVLRVSALEDNDFSRWMENLPNEKQLCPLKDLAIPGSHDSGTFFLDQNMEIGPDESSTIQTLGSIFGKIAKSVVHFLDFITSPHVIQDLPFGEKTITLSTNEVVTVPNVIRMLIPETIVKQYLAYAEESNFTPLSRRTLLNILSVWAASTRKSLQGLDYISSAGIQAFEDLTDVAKRLGDHLMRMTWAKEQRERLMSAKPYLKSDYKVRRYWIRCSGKPVILIYRLLF